MAGVVYLLLIVVAANLGRRRRGWPFRAGACVARRRRRRRPDRGPRPVPRSQWRGPLRRSRRRGERPNYPPRASMNLWAGFIFTRPGGGPDGAGRRTRPHRQRRPTRLAGPRPARPTC